MSEPAVKVEGLSKRYEIGETVGGYGRLTESLSNAIRRPFRRGRDRDHSDGIIWALKDVSLEVSRGEAVGIVGRNGAGKSTLLKILSRITEPTEGRVVMDGRVGSLLEVGTGFHHELTGRENIFLNGAILGMRKREIERSFDEIVAFADVEQFLDTPVKRYSSGMYVRLAFAVAAYLQPEILIVDEVLAVGDAEFQRKCLGKMGEVAREGRTVMFVSHNMAAVTRLCDRVFWLDGGRLLMEGEPEEVVAEYLTRGSAVEGEARFERGLANPGVDEFAILGVRLLNELGEVTSVLDARKSFVVEIRYRVARRLPPCRVGFAINTLQGVTVFAAYDSDDERYSGSREPGEHVARCEVPGHLLNTDQYVLSLNAGIPNVKNLASVHSALTFAVADTGAVGSHVHARRQGVVRPQLAWQQRLERDDSEDTAAGGVLTPVGPVEGTPSTSLLEHGSSNGDGPVQRDLAKDPPAASQGRVRYWPALDGIRGLAILAVMAFHTHLHIAQGGFLGVYVFFVLSGFLITSLLLTERDSTGSTSFRKFYARRALRLLPALFACCLVLLVYSLTVAPSTLAGPTLHGIVASSLYFANWARALGGQSLGLLTHTWSLSVEEQFYLLWPIVLVVLAALLRNRSRVLMVGLVLAGALLAGVERALLAGHVPVLRVLDGSDTNADLLLIGCAAGIFVASGARVDRRWARLLLQGSSLAATVFLALLATRLRITDASFLSRGGMTFVGIAAAAIILQLVLAPIRPMARLLQSRPLVFTGRISYGLYIWHVPVYLAISLSWLHSHALIAVGHVAIAFAVAIASYRWIERPFLRMKRRLSVVGSAGGPPVELEEAEREPVGPIGSLVAGRTTQ